MEIDLQLTITPRDTRQLRYSSSCTLPDIDFLKNYPIEAKDNITTQLVNIFNSMELQGLTKPRMHTKKVLIEKDNDPSIYIDFGYKEPSITAKLTDRIDLKVGITTGLVCGVIIKENP